MRKQLFPLLLIALLCSGVSTAQVRQNIKIMDYGSGQPMAGVQVRCAGQTQTTNAKGLAVFTFPGKAYGDFVDMDFLIKHPGYVSLGMDWNSFRLATDILSKETITFYMVDSKRYYAERDRLFDSLFMHHYRETYNARWEEAAAEVREEPASAFQWFHHFANVNLYNEAKYLLYDVADMISPLDMSYIDSDIRNACEKALLNGDLKGCMELARAQIADNDLSEKNLKRIYYYLKIRKAANDTTPASNYYKILFDNGFSKKTNFVIDYINCLEDEEDDGQVETIRKYAKDSFNDPYMNLIVYRKIPSMDNPAAAIAEELETIRLMEMHTPSLKSAIFHYRARCAARLLVAKDTLGAVRQLDTAFSRLMGTDPNEFSSELAHKHNINELITELFILPSELDSAYPIGREIRETHLRLTRELYQADNSFHNRLFYFYALDNNVIRYDSTAFANLKDMDRMLPELLEEMPGIMYPTRIYIKDLLMETNLIIKAQPDSNISYFNNYKAALPPSERLFPYAYAYGIGNNYDCKKICLRNGITSLIPLLDSYTEELLEKKARHLQKDLVSVKAEYYGDLAEQFYRDGMYEQALPVYDQAIGYHRQTMPSNDSTLLTIQNILMQKGDAYMQIEQLLEAFNCYQQVLDYEKQMPAHLKVPYTLNKAIALYFQADLFTMQQDYKKAMKYYNLSEKAFKQVEKAGDTTFYDRWGEMHYNKSMAHYYAGDNKKCAEEMVLAESLYDRHPMQNASQKYENMKKILADYYKSNNNYSALLKSQTFYFNYCDTMKYNSLEYYNEYVSTAIRLGDIWTAYQLVPAALRYYKAAKEGMDFLMDYGGEKDLQYLQTLFSLGKAYRMADSIPQSLDCLQQCILLNRQLFAEEDPGQCTFNELNVKNQMVKSYMDIPDSARDSHWSDEVLPLQKEIVARLSVMDTNPSLRRNLGYHHRQLGVLYTQLDWPQMALSQYDSCIEIMLPMYRDGDRAETEGDIARSYFSSAAICYYMLDERDEKSARENLDKCLEICENAADPDDLTDMYYYAVNMKLEMLADPFATKDEAAIKKYRKIKTALEKKLGYKNPPSEKR